MSVAFRAIRLRALIPGALLLVSLAARDVGASCNLIPVARSGFGSVLGRIESPISAPSATVKLTLTSCDSSAGFLQAAGSNTVEIRFEPPTGAPSSRFTTGSFTDVCNLGRCNYLEFVVPADIATVPAPNGIAGPARIIVSDGVNTVAEIGELELPTTGCDETPETVFKKFTIVPVPTNFLDASDGTTMEIHATVDGSGSLLVPLDYWGNGARKVLAETPGSPIATFVEGTAAIPAKNAGDTETIEQVLAEQATPSAFVRSYTLDGRPLPPLLRVTDTGSLFGTIDAKASVLRIARNDGQGGKNLYDLSDRVTDGEPIVITGFTVSAGNKLPLASLRSSNETVAYARSEAREFSILNGDGDSDDFIAEVVDAQTGSGFSTGIALDGAFADVLVGSRKAFFPISAGTDAVATIEREEASNIDRNFDGDFDDKFLRVFSESAELTVGQTISASTEDLVDGQPVVVSGTRAFFRQDDTYTLAGTVPSFFDMRLSPDGAHLYTSRNGLGNIDDIGVFSVDPLSKDLTPQSSATIAPREGITDMAFSPGGEHLYVSSVADDAVIVFSRNLLTGALTQVDLAEDGVGGVVGLDAPQSVSVSPDGKHVYVACSLTDSLLVFSRDLLTGELTFVENLVDGIGGVDGIDGAVSVIVSADGANVYVAGQAESAVASFSRNPISGAATYLSSTPANISSLRESSDGDFVYGGSNSLGPVVTVFGRDSLTGELSTLQEISSSSGLTRVAFGPTEASLVVQDLNAVYVYSRDRVTGLLSERRHMPSPPFVDRLTGASDRSFAYVRDQGTRILLMDLHAPIAAYSIGGGIMVTGEEMVDAAVAGDRAIGLSSEELTDVDRNADGDKDDDIASVFDAGASPAETRYLDLAVDRVAISEDIAVLAVSESSEAGLPRNGDGDDDDSVLAVAPADGSGAPTNVGIAVDAVAAIGPLAIVVTPEAAEPAGNAGCLVTAPPGGCDLNGDADATDRVLRIYDSVSGGVTEVGQAVEDFVVSDRYVAFRTPENDQPGIAHLNGDGADGDFVMQIYDTVTGDVIPTNRSAVRCEIPGCDPTVPYKIDPLRDTIAFLTDEADEGVDFDSDGDSADLVLSIFSIRARRMQTVGKVKDDDSTFLEDLDNAGFPFPGGSFTQDMDVTTARECDLGATGVDVNEDGDKDCADVVTLVSGDADADGLYDDFDDCVHGFNPDGTDVDGDELGDARCDRDVELCSALPLVACKQAPAGASSFSISNSATPGKDKFSWRWKKGDQTDLLELGNPVDGNTFYQLCVYDTAGPGLVWQTTVGPAGICEKKPCWTAKSTKGFGFKSKVGFPNGVQKISLGVGGPGKAKAQVKGKGANADVVTLPLTLPATVQLVVFENGVPGACWEGVYTTATQDSEKFKAKN